MQTPKVILRWGTLCCDDLSGRTTGGSASTCYSPNTRSFLGSSSPKHQFVHCNSRKVKAFQVCLFIRKQHGIYSAIFLIHCEPALCLIFVIILNCLFHMLQYFLPSFPRTTGGDFRHLESSRIISVLKIQFVEFMLQTNRGQLITRVSANCC